MFCSSAALAVEINGNPTIDFGKIVQTGEVASVTVDGTVTKASGVIQNFIGNGNSSNAILTPSFANSNNPKIEKVTISKGNTNFEGDVSGCTVTINAQSNPTEPIIVADKDVPVQIVATLTLNGYCKSGEYSGKFKLPYSVASYEAVDRGISTMSEAGAEINDDMYVIATFAINAPLAVEETQALDFGVVLPLNGAAGTVTLDTNGSLSMSGGVTSLHSDISGAKVGQFKITGVSNRQVSVSVGESVVSLSQTGSSKQITATNFTLNPQITLNNTGIGYISVGATLNLPSGLDAGDYLGSYTVKVSY